SEVRNRLGEVFSEELNRLSTQGCVSYVTVDADAVRAADVPGVSAPNPDGLSGHEVAACLRRAGASPQVASCDLVEINPAFDRDDQSCRWAALAVWNFLAGLCHRRG